MFCANCGTQIGDNEKFCKACGTPVNVQAAEPVKQQTPVEQQPVQQAEPQAPKAAQATPSNSPSGSRRACFIVGLITCILLILETLPLFIISGTMLLVGPIAMILGASNSEDFFIYGLLICIGGFILTDLAVMSLVLNSICTKTTAKRPATKCRSLRMTSAILAFIDSVLLTAPAIGINYMVSDAEFFYVILVITFLLAAAFLILAIITNSKEKKLPSV